MSRRDAALRLALAAALSCAASAAYSDSPFEQVGVGPAFASPAPGVSLFGRLDDRWSGSVTATFGAEARVNYERVGSRGGYWTGGVGHFPGAFGIVRAGYGRAWRRGRWRWHLEATLNLPIVERSDDGAGGLGTAVAAAYAVIIPIGFGVHYTFGAR